MASPTAQGMFFITCRQEVSQDVCLPLIEQMLEVRGLVGFYLHKSLTDVIWCHILSMGLWYGPGCNHGQYLIKLVSNWLKNWGSGLILVCWN